MWALSTSWWEMVLRAVVVYAVVFILFRTVGKKQLGQLSPFDFVLILIVSESISQGLSGEEHSLLGAGLSAGTLLLISRVLDYASYKSKRFERLMDGAPSIIIQDGKVVEEARRRALLTMEELYSALRQNEVEEIADLKFAILETNGRMTIVKKSDSKISTKI